LTEREREVLTLAAEGLSASAIGGRLFLSGSTVKTHLAHLYDKLGVSDRAAAVAEAFRRGLLD
jgi:two-component system nitrate/nitrite response regulator NarL